MKYCEGKLLGLRSVTAGRGEALTARDVVVVICEYHCLMPDTLGSHHQKNLIKRIGNESTFMRVESIV